MDASERRALYLDELGGLLGDVSPLERIGALDRVRERIDAAAAGLGHEPSGEEMAGILAGIGPAAGLAAQVRSEPSASTPQAADAGDDDDGDADAGEKVPAPVSAAAAATGEASPAAAADPPPSGTSEQASLARRTYTLSELASEATSFDWPEDSPPRPGMTKRWVPVVVPVLIAVGAALLALMIPIVVLAVGLMLAASSPLWSTREKVIVGVAATVGLGAFIPLAQVSAPMPVIALVLAVAGLVAVVRFAVLGLRESRRLDGEYPPAR